MPIMLLTTAATDLEVQEALAPEHEGKGRKIPVTGGQTSEGTAPAQEKNEHTPAEAQPELEPQGPAELTTETEPEPTVEELQAEIADLAAQLEGQNDALLRAVADLENYKRRALKDLQERTTFANERILAALLAPLDDCDRALEALQGGSDPDAVIEGVQLVARQLHSVVASFGLEEIPAEGKPFDPKLHEAIATAPSDDHEEGTIIRVERRGYTCHGRVLRPAHVIVAQAAKEPSGGESPEAS